MPQIMLRRRHGRTFLFEIKSNAYYSFGLLLFLFPQILSIEDRPRHPNANKATASINADEGPVTDSENEL